MAILERRTKLQRVVFSIVFVIFLLYGLSLIFPFFWAFISSLKTNEEYFEVVWAWPRNWLFSNFGKAFTELVVGDTNLLGMFVNSLWLAFAGTAAAVIVSSMTAYVVAKYDFKFRNFLYADAIFTMIIPIVGNLSAMYKLVNTLNLNNPIGILALYAGGFGFNFIILHGYFRSVSWSYAAFLDGCSDFKAFLFIMIPQAKPALVSIAILAFIGNWNDYTTPFLYLEDTPTVALGLYQFHEIQQYRSDMPIFYAATLLSTIPVFILFAAFQNTIMENMVAGGLK